MILFSLLPASWRPYAKTVVASLGLVLSAITLAVPDAPRPVFVAISLLTALGVYGQRDSDGDGIPDDLEADPGQPEA